MNNDNNTINNNGLEHKVDVVTMLVDQLEISNRRHELIQHIIKLGHWTFDIRKNELQWSDEMFRLFGLDSESFELSYENVLAAIHPDDRAKVDKAYSDSLKNQTKYDIDHRLLMPDGSVKWVNQCCATSFDEDGTALSSIGTVLDITQRKTDEAKIKRLSATYDALSQCNQAIIYCNSIDQLYPTICHSAVTSGAIKMAWIGMLDDPASVLDPIAAFGYGMDYLENLRISISDDQNSWHPMRVALREDKAFWCQDFMQESLDTSWHAQGAHYGWGSMAVLPLHRNNRVIGCFILHASEVNAFDQAIRNLLLEMTTDIDYALKVYDLQNEHQQLEVANRAQIHHLESMQKIADVACSAHAPDEMIALMIEETRNIFNSDRAWAIYPCDPDADFYEIPAESTSAEYPGVFAQKKRIPTSMALKERFKESLNSADPLVYCPMPKSDDHTEQFAARSMMTMIIRPNFGKPWMIGLEQCSDERVWTDDERRLFKSIAARMPNLVSSAYLNRDLKIISKAVQHAGEAVIITDRNDVIEYVNPIFTEITGYLAEEVIGKRTSVLKSDSQNSAIYTILWNTVSSGEIWHGTLTNRKKDGSDYPAMTSVAPIFNDAGEITHFVAHQQDISEQTNLENQFLQAQKMETIGTLVGGIAHDFNNMLGAILGNVFLSRKYSQNIPEIDNRLNSIETLSQRAADMVQQLLSFARKHQIEMSTISLTSFIEEAYHLAKTAIPENIDLVCDVGEEDFIVNADSTQLQQVIMNLLNNARDAVADVSQPKISCKLSAFEVTNEFFMAHPETKAVKLARLTIKDNGYGISKQNINKIFEPFFTTKAVGEGSGLGLAMVFGAIHAHGGILEVTSEMGVETAFHIYLPVIEKSEDGQDDDSVSISRGLNKKILLVDDEDDLREITAEVLNNLGYKVQKACDGEEALQIFRDHQNDIDLILTDIVMPKMGGVALAASIRLRDNDMPIIFASGYSDNNETVLDIEHRLKHSALINKPFSFVELSNLIQKMIRTKIKYPKAS